MNWKESLDRWLTTEPDNPFEHWVDHLYEAYTDDFFDRNELFILNSTLHDKWAYKLFSSEKTTTESALIIERALNIYYKSVCGTLK